MKLALFDSHRFEVDSFRSANVSHGFDIEFIEARLHRGTMNLANGFDAICVFVNDRIDEPVLSLLHERNIRLVALRCAGFNNVDLAAATKFAIAVTNVPEYSPYAVAEHTVALILALNRKLCRAHARVREGNFSLDGLTGFDLHGKTIGIIGTGRIGTALARIMLGFGCRVLAHDLSPSLELAANANVSYVPLSELLRESDVLSLHVPLTPDTRHLLNDETLGLTRKGVMIINTGRGGLIDTQALIRALKSGHIGYTGLDVYEEEAGMFFCDMSEQIIQDDTLARLLTFPNVLITSHQAFLTREALAKIAETTLRSVREFAIGAPLSNRVSPIEAAPPCREVRP